MLTNNQLENRQFFHQEHKEWLNQLNFYQDEIKFFQNELILVLQKHYESLSILDNVEDYRNIFLKKLQHIDELRYDISLHEKKLSGIMEQEPQDLDEHHQVRARLNEFVKDFELLKKNFRRFAAYND